MKKIFFIAVMVTSGLVMVSCEADAIDSTNTQTKHFGVQKIDQKLNQTYTSPLSNTSNPMASDGPGDEVIIITPPKKP